MDIDVSAWSKKATAVLEVAQQEAKRLGNSHVAVEHILLGLLLIDETAKTRFGRRERSDSIHQFLRAYKVTPKRVEEIIRRQNTGFALRYNDSVPLQFSDHAQLAFRLATDETYWMDQQELDVGHLLLGIMLEPKGAVVAKALKINLTKIREDLRKELPLRRIGNPIQRGRGVSRYTPSAQVALSLAQEEARTLKHEQIGAEHLLIGLLRERTGVAGCVLKNLGVDVDYVQARVLQMVPSERQVEVIGLSFNYKRLLDRAGDEMRARNHQLIGTGHLLYHLLRLSEDISVRVLRRLNVKPEDVYTQMEHYMCVQSPLLEGVENTGIKGCSQHIDFAASVREVFLKTLEEAERMEHRMLDTSHLLMGLMFQENNLITTTLREKAVNRQRVRALVELMTAQPFRYSLNPLKFSADLKATVELALEYAQQKSGILDVIHLQLALVSQTETVAVKILKQLQINREFIYHEILTQYYGKTSST